MRICIIAPPWVSVPPHRYGGTELVLDVLARGLQRAGHDVLLVTTGDSTCPVEMTSCFPQAIGVGVGGAALEIRHAAHGYQAARDWGADIIHDHTLAGPLYSAHVDSAPVVTTNHGPFDTPDLASLYQAVGESVDIIAISHSQAASAVATRVAAVIHHGLDVDTVAIGHGDGGYAVWLGRMHPDKGAHVAARAARAAGIPLRIAGKMCEPHEVAYFDAEVRPLLGGDVEYVGEVGGLDKLRLLGAATCLTNPISWAEPFGMVMIEALACGTPVVATARGSVPEIVDHGVTGFIASTERELIQGMVRADALDRSACRRSVQHRFCSERMADDHLALFASIIEERRPSLDSCGEPDTTDSSVGRIPALARARV